MAKSGEKRIKDERIYMGMDNLQIILAEYCSITNEIL
jgi:hypothetical protein